MRITLIIVTFGILSSLMAVPIKCIAPHAPPKKDWINDWYLALAKVEYSKYKDLLGYLESGNQILIQGGAGNKYRSIYQFCKATSEYVGVPYDSLFSLKWSDLALDRFTGNNWYLLRDCHKYQGKVIKGIKITKAGMLAGAHLKGWSFVRLFLISKGMIDGRDFNGVPVSSYIRRFQHIELTTYPYELDNDQICELRRGLQLQRIRQYGPRNERRAIQKVQRRLYSSKRP